jgi:hypothetical protein
MLQAESTLKGYAIEASDGKIGTVSDFLFHDQTWKVRWLVVDTGAWLPGRKVLLHPSAIGKCSSEEHLLGVTLTKAKVEGSPSILHDQPVSQQMERHLYDYYGWNPALGDSYFGGNPNAIALPLALPLDFGGTEVVGLEPLPTDGDPHLRSIAAVTGYHIEARDGEIGHIEDFLLDDAHWDIRYLVIDTKNWWPGEHVLISPYAVREISWPDRLIRLDVTRDKVKASPTWAPDEMMGPPYEKRVEAYEKRLHQHYGWPGYGWF